jgi:hypothetical protein
MKLWKQWSRKVDGWVERRRRFHKTGVETPLASTVQKVQTVPVVLGTTAADEGVGLPKSR